MQKLVTITLLAGALVGALILPFAQLIQSPDPPTIEAVLFAPTKFPDGHWEPERLNFEDVTFSSHDGAKLHGWYCEATDPRGSALIVHGNAGNVSTRARLLRHLQTKTKVNAFVFDYQGYGRSEGKPTLENILADTKVARSELRKLAKVKNSEMLIIGESLGGAIAVQLSAESSPRALILQSTFPSLRDVAEFHYPHSANSISKSLFDSVSAIPEFEGPLLQTHGENDNVIPIRLGTRLFDSAKGDKTFLAIPQVGHNDWQTDGYYAKLDKFIDRVLAADSESASDE